MRTRADAGKRIGAAVLTVATVLSASPHAKAVEVNKAPVVDSTDAKPPKKSKRSWGWRRTWSMRNVHAVRHPSAIEIVLAMARRQLGKPYVYGSGGPTTFDCSGLTQFVWAAAGVNLPHNAAAQYTSMRHVALKNLRPGDLVFSGGWGIGHVGIYIGKGKMIHAPHSGARVQVSPIHANSVGGGRPE
jgi:cell wall-associated NlpC family hydrolase